jgi:hypothetical protein
LSSRAVCQSNCSRGVDPTARISQISTVGDPLRDQVAQGVKGDCPKGQLCRASVRDIFASRSPRCRPRSDQRTVEDWGSGSDNFLKDPPNATVSVFQKDGNGVRDAVVLNNPKLEGETLAFDIDVLEGDIKGADWAASVFIDIIGRPLTPMSFAGVARRTAYRGAYYAGAAAVGAAGVGAAAYGAYGPRCGYYPYPPRY